VGDTIASSYSSIEEQEMQWLRDFIHDFLENNIFPALETRESYIVKNRYGLNEKHEELTLQQLADSLNLSTERIRQLEKQALTKIREMNIAYVLKDLLQYS
jgi:RNA polymerase sigma factor (sigma-70 family)